MSLTEKQLALLPAHMRQQASLEQANDGETREQESVDSDGIDEHKQHSQEHDASGEKGDGQSSSANPAYEGRVRKANAEAAELRAQLANHAFINGKLLETQAQLAEAKKAAEEAEALRVELAALKEKTTTVTGLEPEKLAKLRETIGDEAAETIDSELKRMKSQAAKPGDDYVKRSDFQKLKEETSKSDAFFSRIDKSYWALKASDEFKEFVNSKEGRTTVKANLAEAESEMGEGDIEYINDVITRFNAAKKQPAAKQTGANAQPSGFGKAEHKLDPKAVQDEYARLIKTNPKAAGEYYKNAMAKLRN